MDIDYSRYKFFYKLFNLENKFDEIKKIVFNEIDILSSTLLVLQSKIWIDQ